MENDEVLIRVLKYIRLFSQTLILENVASNIVKTQNQSFFNGFVLNIKLLFFFASQNKVLEYVVRNHLKHLLKNMSVECYV